MNSTPSESDMFEGDEASVMYCEEIPDEETRKIQANIFRRLIQKRLSVNDLEKWKMHLDTHMAISWCDLCICQNILELMMDVEKVAADMERGHCECETETRTVCSWKLIHLACAAEDYYPVLLYLLRTKVFSASDYCFGDYPSVVHIATVCNQEEILKLLIEKGADVNYAQSGIECPLYVAIKNQYDKIVELLLACDRTKVNICTTRGHALLIHCMRTESVYTEKLLQAGADPNGIKNCYRSPLNYAIQLNNKKLVGMLIKYGADINLQSNRGDTALYIAVYSGKSEMVEMLLDAGADPNKVSNEDDNPLTLITCYDGQADLLKVLLKYHADPQKTNHLGYTALHIAAWNGYLECVQILLKSGVSHDLHTSDMNTPLALAAHGGYLNVIKELLPLGCNVNNKDKDLDTPLHYAAYNGMTEAVELLISNGANPDTPNACNATPLWNAVYRGKKEVLKLLLKANAVMECKSVGIDQHSHTNDVRYVYNSPKSPLWVAIDRGYPEIALLLVSAGYDIFKEEWLLNDDFPNDFDNPRLRSLLLQYTHAPAKLISICRNYFRRYFGQLLPTKVTLLDLPESVKSYLTLADLKYTKNPADSTVFDDEEDDDD